MFYYPHEICCPQYFYYLCMPNNQNIPPEKSTANEQIHSEIKISKGETVTPNEERLLLTRQDLEKQGYEQTKKPWTKEEDKLLMKLCKNPHARFQEIAAMIQGRNAKMCYSRYRRLTYETRVGWSKHEDDLLLALVQQHGDNSWKELTPMFKGRTHKQLKDHYMNYLRSDLLKSEWTIEEDLELIRLINLHGKNWKLVQEAIQGRSRNQIKNRYFGRILRLNRKKMEELS